MIRSAAALGRVLTALCAAFPAFMPAGAAQTTLSAEASATRVRFDGEALSTIGSISPLLQWEGADRWAAAGGTISSFEGGGWGMQLIGTGAQYFAPIAGLQPEVAGAVEASRAPDGTRTGEVIARGRLHWLGASHGLWLGAGAGWADGVTGTQTVGVGELGGWVRRSAVTLVATLEPSWVGDTIRTVDAEALVRVVQGRAEGALFGGVRRQRAPAGAAERWAGVSGAWWFSDRFAATAGYGSYPPDLARELTGGRYLSLGIRFASRRPEIERADRPAYRILPSLAQPVVAEFGVADAGPGQRRITALARGARRVEIMGDFTDWQPVSMQRLPGGRWTATLPIPDGVHRMNIRVDGGEWGVPPGVPTLRDDFSGVVALLTVGEGR